MLRGLLAASRRHVLTPAQRKQLHKHLLELREELGGKARIRIDPNRTSDEETGGDEDEQPLNEMLQSIASSRNRHNHLILLRVEKALRKLDADPEDFGTCESCGEDILLGRLKAMPYAELCTDCQSTRDAPKGLPTRKKLTDYQ
ncbi:MAG TPA: TraR/DksA C4-type zinc finger protein [Vulgatibacter sp.]